MGYEECVHIQNREGFIKEGSESSKNHSGVLEGVQIDRAFIKEGCSDIEVLLYLVSVAESPCSGAERLNPGRPSNKVRHPSSPQRVAQLNAQMHLLVIGTRRRCAYCSTKEVQIRPNVECSTCKLVFFRKRRKKLFL